MTLAGNPVLERVDKAAFSWSDSLGSRRQCEPVLGWTAHATANATSAAVALTKNQRYAITAEHFDNAGTGVARLLWKTPAGTSFVVLPIARMYAN